MSGERESLSIFTPSYLLEVERDREPLDSTVIGLIWRRGEVFGGEAWTTVESVVD